VSQQSAAATGEKIAKQRKSLDLNSQRQRQGERKFAKQRENHDLLHHLIKTLIARKEQEQEQRQQNS
jgi:hypothetical protein